MGDLARKLQSEMSPVVWRVKKDKVGLVFSVSGIVSCHCSLLPLGK